MLRRLQQLGVDVVLTNSGTDFPPVIEALAEAQSNGSAVPDVMVVPHEHVAMGMAHGYFAATGRTQAVFLHTNVGLANGAIGAINAATEQVPMILMSGRTPVTEQGRFGSRTVPIGWGQEMRDQTALVREASKWDYELRFPEQIPELLDRAHAIAGSTPSGPVYLSLPREVLSETCPPDALESPISMRPASVRAAPAQLDEAAGALLEADNPLILAQRGAGSPEGFASLARLSDRYSIPVCQYWAVETAIPEEHPMNVGQDPAPWLKEADLLLVINSLAPWNPDEHRPSGDCRVIQIAPDPLFERFPVRNFRSDLSIRGEVGPALAELEEAMNRIGDRTANAVSRRGQRHERISASTEERRRRVSSHALAGNGSPMSKDWVSWCLGRAIKGMKATVASELGCPLPPLMLGQHGSWRQEPHSGGLGWSLPYAMGLKLGDPDRLVVATMGDGSYMFANPVACHQVANRHQIPVISVVLNNEEYGAVRGSVLHQYPSGYAAKADEMPLVSIPTAGDLSAVARSCGAHAETVVAGDELPAALERAMESVTRNGTQAMVEVMVE